MLTNDDVAAVPIFSKLPAATLERLARTSADLRLAPGEFAVSEGGERALYAVLSGMLEVVKLFDGVERRLGWRRPGTLFGEVPLALASPFPGGYRAAEPSRVMRVGLEEYYHLLAASKDFAEEIGALARERLGGLQSLSAEPHAPRVTLIGDESRDDFRALRRFLARNQISFAVEGSSGDAGATIAQLADGRLLVAPQSRDLAERLGLQTQPRRGEYDVAIVGAGPAGLA
ncbi:MAG TPA: cyclic nucleotide-binding domain-containing protein, partial [Caulobacteraceae bacterium]|nr:cyclic nucleotide-binding domain-containing protein [Caulobacteraceae bacterium]